MCSRTSWRQLRLHLEQHPWTQGGTVTAAAAGGAAAGRQQHVLIALATVAAAAAVAAAVRSPMGFTFYLAIINNIFSIAGLAGVLNAQVRHSR
jgi:hypothetical protein